MKTFVVAKFDSYEGTNSLEIITGESEEIAMLSYLLSQGWVGNSVKEILAEACDYYCAGPLEITNNLGMQS